MKLAAALLLAALLVGGCGDGSSSPEKPAPITTVKKLDPTPALPETGTAVPKPPDAAGAEDAARAADLETLAKLAAADLAATRAAAAEHLPRAVKELAVVGGAPEVIWLLVQAPFPPSRPATEAETEAIAKAFALLDRRRIEG